MSSRTRDTRYPDYCSKRYRLDYATKVFNEYSKRLNFTKFQMSELLLVQNLLKDDKLGNHSGLGNISSMPGNEDDKYNDDDDNRCYSPNKIKSLFIK